jgi:uncharacterized membrane protein YedE/YeeE
MKFDAVLLLVFFISLALVGASVLGLFRPIPFVSDHSYGFIIAGYALLVIGILFKSR